jgi:hypothetical protein
MFRHRCRPLSGGLRDTANGYSEIRFTGICKQVPRSEPSLEDDDDPPERARDHRRQPSSTIFDRFSGLNPKRWKRVALRVCRSGASLELASNRQTEGRRDGVSSVNVGPVRG